MLALNSFNKFIAQVFVILEDPKESVSIDKKQSYGFDPFYILHELLI